MKPVSSGRIPSASEILDVMHRLEQSPEGRIKLLSSVEIFQVAVTAGLISQDAMDWFASAMQQLHKDELIEYEGVSGGSFPRERWDGYWIQQLHGWRVTARGRQDASLFQSQAPTAATESPTRPIPAAAAVRTAEHSTREHDVFISHASEDKQLIARPLADALLAKGLAVWYDEFSLDIGDSLRSSIDDGLATSRHGIVILSHAFFAKHWSLLELNGLTAREAAEGSNIILPVWHEISHAEVAKYSPTLADRLAASTEEGLAELADRLAAVLMSSKSPSSTDAKNHEKAEQQASSAYFTATPAGVHVHQLESGAELVQLSLSANEWELDINDVPSEFQQVAADVLQEIQETGDILGVRTAITTGPTAATSTGPT